jgi:hypothetical protein
LTEDISLLNWEYKVILRSAIWQILLYITNYRHRISKNQRSSILKCSTGSCKTFHRWVSCEIFVIGGKGNVVKTLLKFLFVALVWNLPVPCDAGSDLSAEEAARLIRARFGYPVAVSIQINFREKSPEMLAYLKSNGYIVDKPAQTCCGDFYATTDKGKPYFGDFVKYLSGRNLTVDCVYVKKDIKSIEAISANRKKSTATVTFIEGLEPNEPVYSEVFKKNRNGVQDTDFKKTQRIKVKLGYVSKGWRVEGK